MYQDFKSPNDTKPKDVLISLVRGYKVLKLRINLSHRHTGNTCLLLPLCVDGAEEGSSMTVTPPVTVCFQLLLCI